jgi:DNA invertase Pin-like site-specific DNA recombinase
MQDKKSNLVSRAALYCRLSKDDDVHGDSESIKTQKAMLTQYAEEHGISVYDIYVDDGYSGLDFERPDFQRMIEDIENGKIGTVITKDLSRLGRDHLKVGFYTEIYFPTKHVRYIAINDGVDSNGDGNDIAALKNVINEFYSRDISRKIRSSIKARSKQGLYRATFNPLGYKKEAGNCNHLVIDEETAHIVRKIFELAAQGWGRIRIVKYLERENIPCPAWYLHSRGEKDYSKKFSDPAEKCHWYPTVISGIIKNPMYIGTTVNCKTEKIFKVGLQVKTPAEKRIVVENTHEPIVSREMFDTANEKMKARTRTDANGEVTIFAGLLKCADCGKQMSKRYYPKSKKYVIFICGTYAYRGKDKCGSEHKIFYDDLYSAVLKDIRMIAGMTLRDRDAVVSALLKKRGLSTRRKKDDGAARIATAEKRLAEVERAFDKLYEDRLTDKISESNFSRLSVKYQDEQSELETQIEAMRLIVGESAKQTTEIEQFAELISSFVNLEELTAEILHELIDRIEVHERTDDNGTYRQQIDIYYRFIGLIGGNEFRMFKPESGATQRWRGEREKAAAAQI